MEFKELQNFLTVVKEENISKAAEIIHITQPALSRQMSMLEEKLDCKLFVRGKRLKLTEDGLNLYKRAETLIAMMQKIENDFKSNSELIGEISIGTGGLSDTDKMRSDNYEIGDLAYWSPGGSVVILYKQNGEQFQRAQLGHINEYISFFENIQSAKVTFELIK